MPLQAWESRTPPGIFKPALALARAGFFIIDGLTILRYVLEADSFLEELSDLEGRSDLEELSDFEGLSDLEELSAFEELSDLEALSDLEELSDLDELSDCGAAAAGSLFWPVSGFLSSVDFIFCE